MPRPKRTRRTRPMAQEASAPAQSQPDAIPSTPLKPTEAASVDSSEKENRLSTTTRSRATAAGSTRRGRALRDSTMMRRSSSAARPEIHDDFAVEDDSRELSDAENIGTGRRETATPLTRRDLSGLDIDDEVFSDMYSALEPPSTRGRSANTSTMSAGQFKRRSRAPSVISRDGGPIRPSSRGMNTPSVSSTFNFGQFRRRAREPSILGRNRRPHNESRVTDQSASESELDGEDFAPDAVSTPLDRRRSQRTASASRASHAPSSGLRSRKRKSGEVDREESDRPEKTTRVEQDQPEPEPAPQQEPAVQDPITNSIESDDDDLSSLSDISLPSPVSGVAVRGERPVTPVHASMEEIMAPPASSGSEGDAEWPSIRRLANRRRRAVTPTTPLHARNDDDILSNVSSPPSLTHSPNFPARKKGAKTRGRTATRDPVPEPLTSALASLLPQRRSKNARGEAGSDSEEDEVDYSGIGPDEDELAYSRSTRRRVASRSRGRGASARPPSRQASARAQATQDQAEKEPNRRLTRTYGARSADADDSFAPLPEDSFTEAGLVLEDPKHELKNATRKFKEVDRWELSFEEVAENPEPSDADAR